MDKKKFADEYMSLTTNKILKYFENKGCEIQNANTMEILILSNNKRLLKIKKVFIEEDTIMVNGFNFDIFVYNKNCQFEFVLSILCTNLKNDVEGIRYIPTKGKQYLKDQLIYNEYCSINEILDIVSGYVLKNNK